jgi:phage-related protein
MKINFEVEFLQEAIDFLEKIDKSAREKIIYNIRKAQIINDPVLFKKITNEIWEFRTLHKKLQYRLFAFWNKTGNRETLVIATHGIVKKTQKTPKNEIEKAMRIMNNYFKDL